MNRFNSQEITAIGMGFVARSRGCSIIFKMNCTASFRERSQGLMELFAIFVSTKPKRILLIFTFFEESANPRPSQYFEIPVLEAECSHPPVVWPLMAHTNFGISSRNILFS